MSDVDTLVRFLRTQGVAPWVTDEFGRSVRVADWASEYVAAVVNTHREDDAEQAERLAQLRAELDEKPDRKSISVKKIREIIDP